MAVNTVSDVTTSGAPIPYNDADTRLYLGTYAGTLSSSEEVPLSAGSLGLTGGTGVQFVESHNGGQIPFTTRGQYQLAFSTYAPTDNTVVNAIMVSARAEVQGTGYAKTMKGNTIYGDGSRDAYLSIMTGGTIAGATSGAFQVAFTGSIYGSPVFTEPA